MKKTTIYILFVAVVGVLLAGCETIGYNDGYYPSTPVVGAAPVVIRPSVYVAPRPVYYAPPRPVYYAPPRSYYGYGSYQSHYRMGTGHYPPRPIPMMHPPRPMHHHGMRGHGPMHGPPMRGRR